MLQDSLRRELQRKGVVYAWSADFLNRLRQFAAIDDDVFFEDFGGPRAVPGLHLPPIGMARLRKERT